AEQRLTGLPATMQRRQRVTAIDHRCAASVARDRDGDVDRSRGMDRAVDLGVVGGQLIFGEIGLDIGDTSYERHAHRRRPKYRAHRNAPGGVSGERRQAWIFPVLEYRWRHCLAMLMRIEPFGRCSSDELTLANVGPRTTSSPGRVPPGAVAPGAVLADHGY